jgi:hypothetical protein
VRQAAAGPTPPLTPPPLTRRCPCPGRPNSTLHAITALIKDSFDSGDNSFGPVVPPGQEWAAAGYRVLDEDEAEDREDEDEDWEDQTTKRRFDEL